MDIKTFSELLAIGCMIGGLLYRVIKAESAIYTEIDKQGDILTHRLHEIENAIAVNKNDYENYQERTDYLIHGLKEKIDHKFNRLHQSQKEFSEYLKKHHDTFINVD
ncbi:MAG: hypothetical protein N3E45_17145 [Oscillatoriaceae bacterium SKW80]|nr:hypothetical protein [Oscillatoriaceae bacterium SKW80]HIK27962.1 hypothetical protein [Oscillatoriaceae cyanobacterium M7585_C2015_266]